MKRLICLPVVLLALFAVPAFAAPGNIYLTGHDLDFHCAFQTAPTQCNAFKIAIALARAGAPDPNKPVLFLDEGSELAFAAQNIGLTAPTDYKVVKPTSAEFTGVERIALDTANYSAIVIASHVSCGGCDNTDNAVTAINGRTSDIQGFFAQGGGLVYLAGAAGTGYYDSVPTAYAVTPTTTSPGNPPAGCLSDPANPALSCYQLTPAGKSLGLTNDDANCCATHNSFAPEIIVNAPTLDSAANASLISAELDGAESPNDETLYAVGASAGTQYNVLTFTPGQTSQTATFNCTSNQIPCPDTDAHSIKFSVGSVSQTFMIVVTATEVTGEGICQSGNPNDPTDYDCRFAKFFGQPPPPVPNIKVPFCTAYSHGNCVFYNVTGAPPVNTDGTNGFYSGGVREYIAWNNVVPTPLGYLSTPHMYDDPSDDSNLCACYPTTTPGYPYSPEDNQYVFDITTFFKEEAMQVGKDPGTGGRTPTFNQFGIAFPIATGDVYRWISPLSTNSNTTTIKKGSTLPVKFQLRDATGSNVSNALVPPNFVRIAVLDNNGVSQPVIGTSGGFVYDGSKQQYQVNLSTSPYLPNITYTIVVNGNLFSQQIAKFKISK